LSTALRKGATCPSCKAAKLVPIVFGLPSSELAAIEELHEIVLGGCVVTGDDPTLECLGCATQFMRNGELSGNRANAE